MIRYSKKLKMGYNSAMGQYLAWLGMLDRCYDPDHKLYPRYGRRGIEIYNGWTPWGNPNGNSFKQFRDDIHREIGGWPGPGYSLDRIDNDGHYEPGNLRWATLREQAANTILRGVYKPTELW